MIIIAYPFPFFWTHSTILAVRVIGGVTTNGSNFLYTTEYNYMDFNVDDNGLWVIYGTPYSNNTIVAKVIPLYRLSDFEPNGINTRVFCMQVVRNADRCFSPNG